MLSTNDRARSPRPLSDESRSGPLPLADGTAAYTAIRWMLLTIGQRAKQTGIKVETIRFYERERAARGAASVTVWVPAVMSALTARATPMPVFPHLLHQRTAHHPRVFHLPMAAKVARRQLQVKSSTFFGR